MNPLVRVIVAMLTMVAVSSAGANPNPKSLSAEKVQGYLSGKGMGFAKVAELNGYPGPAHVLELAEPLQLTAAQKQASQKLFDTMQSKAVTLGKDLVNLEQELDELFTSRQVTQQRLANLLAKIGDLNTRLRQVHIEAHLAQRLLLSEDQVVRYKQLRAHHHH